MINFIKGCNIKNSSNLSEEYTIEENAIRANVNAEKILKLIKEFVKKQDKKSSLFLFIEVPCSLNDETIKKEATDTEPGIMEESHNDVYYLDGIPQPVANKILDIGNDILINDGMVIFGIGNHNTGDEIGKYKYNEVFLYFKDDIKDYESIFINNKLEKNIDLISPWDLINENNPGESNKYTNENGMDIYDLIKTFEESFEEFYKAEKRES